ncbi:MAG: caspase family protein [Burkholderiales bacterium]|nr:caspase family protein [Burkholderiales bacterium]
MPSLEFRWFRWFRWSRLTFRLTLACAAAALAGAAAAQPAAPAKPQGLEKRVALVIGNAAYRGGQQLPNAANDAEDLCKALRKLAFDTLCVRDVKTRRDFKRAVQDFRARLGPGVAGLFYYAGHGIQVDGDNFLLPTEAVIDAREDVEDESLSLRYVMQTLEEAGNGFNLIILDACRNNPFIRGFSRATQRGLAPVSDAPSGSIVLYSTAANDVASDGGRGERNSPFAKHLLNFIGKPGLTVETLIKRVSAAVQQETERISRRRQVPFTYGSFIGEFCFAGCQDPEAEARARREREDLDRRRQEIEAREASGGRPASRANVPPSF